VLGAQNGTCVSATDNEHPLISTDGRLAGDDPPENRCCRTVSVSSARPLRVVQLEREAPATNATTM
jgi:hypothetical protein